jgi:hypothetical protein
MAAEAVKGLLKTPKKNISAPKKNNTELTIKNKN